MAICIIFTMACKNNSSSPNKNKSTTAPKIFSDYLGVKITQDFKGIVLDDKNMPIKNTLVSIGNKTTLTDALGRFEIKKANVNRHFVYIEFKKKDFVDTSITIEKTDTIGEISVQLIKEFEPCLFWFCKHNHNLP